MQTLEARLEPIPEGTVLGPEFTGRATWYPEPSEIRGDFDPGGYPALPAGWLGMMVFEPPKVTVRTTQTIDPAELPTVSIALRPDIWPIKDFVTRKAMAPEIRSQLRDWDFWVIRLACTFNPVTGAPFTWARFIASLAVDGEMPATAFAMHPERVDQAVKTTVGLSFSPTLTFKEAQVNLGKVERQLEYPELEPLVVAYGFGESTPSWKFEPARGISLQGAKWMHLVAKVPKGSRNGRATLSIVAEVRRRVGGIRIPLWISPAAIARDTNTALLWP
ncbi:MAG TPA: hypothetical protein VFR33_13315 [Candidatus Dormibacteraeota bacterium]|nr:hypothetical protein [Candidatus Dormibacteraeota bacterium]